MVDLSDEEAWEFIRAMRRLNPRNQAIVRALMRQLLKLQDEDEPLIGGRWQIDKRDLTDPDRALIRDIASASQWTQTELTTVRCCLGDRPPGFVEKFLRGLAQEPLPEAG